MKAKVLLLLAVFLLATGFGNCEAKEEEKPADPLDAEITDTAENEAKPTLEFFDVVPFSPKKNKERWFNIVITIGNNRPGDSTFFFPENPEFEPASSPRETAKGNNDWVNNTVLYVTIGIAIALFLTIVALLLTLKYYQKHNRNAAASKSSSQAGASSKPPSSNIRGRIYPCRISQANIKLIARLMNEKKSDDLDRLV